MPAMKFLSQRHPFAASSITRQASLLGVSLGETVITLGSLFGPPDAALNPLKAATRIGKPYDPEPGLPSGDIGAMSANDWTYLRASACPTCGSVSFWTLIWTGFCTPALRKAILRASNADFTKRCSSAAPP